jgi:hypothetical protein
MANANGMPLSLTLEEDNNVAKAKASYEQAQARWNGAAKGKVIQQHYSTMGYSSHPTNRLSATQQPAVLSLPTPVPSASFVPTTTPPLNMELQNSSISQRMMVKDCVKTTLFRRVKFFIKDIHGLYDLRDGSVCSLIIANCNVMRADVDQYWWAEMRKVIVSTHTDRRNNVIKNIRLRFNGTWIMMSLYYFKYHDTNLVVVCLNCVLF